MLTNAQLNRYKESYEKEKEWQKHRQECLTILQSYHKKCLEGYEKGFSREVENGVKVAKSTAVGRHTAAIESLQDLIDISISEVNLIDRRAASIDKQLEVRGMCPAKYTLRKRNAPGTRPPGRPRKGS